MALWTRSEWRNRIFNLVDQRGERARNRCVLCFLNFRKSCPSAIRSSYIRLPSLMLNHIFVAGRFMSPPLLLLLIVLSWDRTSGQEGCDDGCPPAPLVKKIPPSTAQYEYATSILSDSRSGDTVGSLSFFMLRIPCYSDIQVQIWCAQSLQLACWVSRRKFHSSLQVCSSSKWRWIEGMLRKDTGNFVRRYADGREVAVGATDEYVCRESRSRYNHK